MRRVYVFKFKVPVEKIEWPEYLDRLYEKITTDGYLYGELDSVLIHEPEERVSVVELHVHPVHEGESISRIKSRVERSITELDREIEMEGALSDVMREVRNLRSVSPELQKHLNLWTG